VLTAAAVAVPAACATGSSSRVDNPYGSCKIGPGAVCRDQDLRAVSLVSADLRGADFTGSNLGLVDFRDADLRDALLVGTDLAGADFTGANLAGADLTDASTFFTNFSLANLEGANTAALKRCAVIEPDGRFDPGSGFCQQITSATTNPPTQSSPTLEYFRAAKPAVCLNDVSGTGIEVTWKATGVLGITFFVDGVRVGGSKKTKGTTRIPFVCDGKPHTVGVQAYGAVPPSLSESFTLALEPGAPG